MDFMFTAYPRQFQRETSAEAKKIEAAAITKVGMGARLEALAK
jgi:hypothetical protein